MSASFFPCLPRVTLQDDTVLYKMLILEGKASCLRHRKTPEKLGFGERLTNGKMQVDDSCRPTRVLIGTIW
jgi:hypothetical protein